jgi:hypothetical protein
VDGRKIPVPAEQLHGPGRSEAWRQIAAAVPCFAQYQRKTDRELPVIRLVPRSGEPSSRRIVISSDSTVGVSPWPDAADRYGARLVGRQAR